jgi:hypothetical protein
MRNSILALLICLIISLPQAGGFRADIAAMDSALKAKR